MAKKVKFTSGPCLYTGRPTATRSLPAGHKVNPSKFSEVVDLFETTPKGVVRITTIDVALVGHSDTGREFLRCDEDTDLQATDCESLLAAVKKFHAAQMRAAG